MAQILSYQETLASILTAFKNQWPDADVSPGSVLFATAAAQAAAVAGLYSHQHHLGREILPDTATATLDRHAYIEGLARKPASAAAGSVTLTGQNGTVVAAGLEMAAPDGWLFVTRAGGTIALGVLTIAAQAQTAGAAGNIPSASKLALQSPPPGIDAAATAAAAFTDGTDAESNADLRSRILTKRRKPPAGGNANDYRAWALEVAGVNDAVIYPLRLGLGSVSVVVLASGSGSARIPAQPLIDSVIAHINAVRPVGCPILQVFGPTAKPTAVTAAITLVNGYAFAAVQSAVIAAVADYAARLAPLATLRRSQLFRIIMEIDGVGDCAITTPAADVTALDTGGTSIEMITPGAITVTQA